MHDFIYKNKKLHCEDVSVETVARKVGTPFYLYSHHTLTDHFTKIQKAFANVNPLICFAMKSNGNLAVLKTLINLGAGVDIVSIGELKKALLAGADPRKMVFASVGKTGEEIKVLEHAAPVNVVKWEGQYIASGSDDKTVIEAKLAALSEASAPIAQKMYAEAAPADAGGSAAKKEAEGDVVDAEFEEVKENK